MNIVLVAQLADAAATLESSLESVETGSPAWVKILHVQVQVEALIEAEVSGALDPICAERE